MKAHPFISIFFLCFPLFFTACDNEPSLKDFHIDICLPEDVVQPDIDSVYLVGKFKGEDIILYKEKYNRNGVTRLYPPKKLHSKYLSYPRDVYKDYGGVVISDKNARITNERLYFYGVSSGKIVAVFNYQNWRGSEYAVFKYSDSKFTIKGKRFSDDLWIPSYYFDLNFKKGWNQTYFRISREEGLDKHTNTIETELRWYWHHINYFINN